MSLKGEQRERSGPESTPVLARLVEKNSRLPDWNNIADAQPVADLDWDGRLFNFYKYNEYGNKIEETVLSAH